MIDWIKTAQVGRDRRRGQRDHGRPVEPRPAAPLDRAGADARRIEALEQFNRDTRRPVLDQACWSANPLAVHWPETGVAS